MSDQAAFQEIDDAVRQDEIKAWWKRWGVPVLVACVVVIAVTVGVMQYRKYEEGQRALAGSAFSAALAKIGQDNAAARVELEKQAQSAPEPYRALAALAAAQLQDKPEAVIAALQAAAVKLPPELSDLALVIAAYHSVDTPEVQAVVGKLDTLTGAERPFRASVKELQALAAWKKGDLKRARDLWTEISRDTSSPQGELQRAQALLALTGPAESPATEPKAPVEKKEGK